MVKSMVKTKQKVIFYFRMSQMLKAVLWIFSDKDVQPMAKVISQLCQLLQLITSVVREFPGSLGENSLGRMNGIDQGGNISHEKQEIQNWKYTQKHRDFHLLGL